MMAAGDTMQGRRVEMGESIWSWELGDYCPVFHDDGRVKALWFKLPSGSAGRILAIGSGEGSDDDPEWTITIEDDETVTVAPSIEQQAIPDERNPDAAIPYWHGYLEHGVWREV